MRATMTKVNGAGLAAPQIGVNLQLVIFGSEKKNPRYPDRPLVPPTVLINPVIKPIGEEQEDGWEGCLSVPGLRYSQAYIHINIHIHTYINTYIHTTNTYVHKYVYTDNIITYYIHTYSTHVS